MSRVELAFRRLKYDTPALHIPILDMESCAELECITYHNWLDFVDTLCRWRDANQFVFTSQFKVTNSGTATWVLNKVLKVNNKILFIVRSCYPIGHLGLANCTDTEAEIDNVIRGEIADYPGIMDAAMRTIVNWAMREFNIKKFFLRVRADNSRAIQFYSNLGYRITGDTTLNAVAMKVMTL